MPNGLERLHGDCREVLATLPADSIDACVTDPPYHLGPNQGRSSRAPEGMYATMRTGFMGKSWDGGNIAADPDTWRAVLRVLKPGAHLVAFGGTRTQHRMVCAIEDAGFEIRDCLCWLYGVGFPKSLNVSRALWKEVLACQSRASAPLVVQVSESILLHCDGEKEPIAAALALILPGAAPALLTEIGAVGGSSAVTVTLLSESAAASISLSTGLSWNVDSDALSKRPNTSTTETKSSTTISREIWQSLVSAHTLHTTTPDQTLADGRMWCAASVGGLSSDTPAKLSATPILTVLGPATWNPVIRLDGIGSSLKPAWEPIILARKPLIGTVAQNVLAHGCGGLNIDASRVPASDALVRPAIKQNDNGVYGHGLGQGTQVEPAGRWPANVLHDGSDEVEAAFAAFGDRPGAVSNGRKGVPGIAAQGLGAMAQVAGRCDSGSASRFFFSAKAGKGDRAGSGHPTIKPIALMRWLCRLVTPPNGRILDPFAGSGTTGEAAMLEGFSALLIEQATEHSGDIEHRIGRWHGADLPLFAEAAD